MVRQLGERADTLAFFGRREEAPAYDNAVILGPPMCVITCTGGPRAVRHEGRWSHRLVLASQLLNPVSVL